MSLSFLEQETVILWNRAEDTATVNTYEPSLIRKLDAMCRIDTAVAVLRRGDNWAVYKLPKRYVKVLRPRQYTEETLDKIRARAKALSNKRKEEANAE